MSFSLTEDQRLIQDSAAAFLAEAASHERLRAALDSAPADDPTLWTGLASELGYAGLMVPTAYGGSGLGAVEMSLVLEETGRRLAVAPFFETAVLAVQAILLAGTDDQKATALPEIAQGRVRAALAMTGTTGAACPDGVTAQLRRTNRGWRLSGEAGFVTFAHVADRIGVVARAPGSQGTDGLTLLTLDAKSPGLSIEPLPSLDATRPYCRLAFRDMLLPQEALLGDPEAAGPAVHRLLAIGAGLLAAEQVGGADFCLASTVDYAKQRVQFGRTIASFQAVKHELADMMVAVEAARSASWYAAAAIDQGTEELFEAASVARVWCSEAYRRCAAEAIQLHGGIGFTWEHFAHLYFKRARSSSTWLGEPAQHRERIARLIGLEELA